MRILFATDGSTPAREGELLVQKLFAPASDIHVFTVAPELRYDWLGPVGYPELAHLDAPALSGDQVAAEAADRLGRAGFNVSSSATHGHPGTEILRMVGKEDIDLVVLGASHRTWLGNLLMGSVSTYVLHHAPCSVLVAHRSPTGSGKVLVGADGSDSAASAIQMVSEVLDRSRCSVKVATVVAQPWASSSAIYPHPPLLAPTLDYPSIEERIEQGWVLAKRAAEPLHSADFNVAEVVLVGSPENQLLKEADSISADLVVVGSRGHGPIRRTFLGSVSDQLVRHAPATLVGRIRREAGLQ